MLPAFPIAVTQELTDRGPIARRDVRFVRVVAAGFVSLVDQEDEPTG
jgi:hypothetical protein